MKGRNLKTCAIVMVLFTLAVFGAADAAIWFVNVQEGNDGYNGLYEVYVGGINGPKRSINAAIQAASPGDIISVAYANGNLYSAVAPTTDKNLTFTSTGIDAPRVYGWETQEIHTFTGEFTLANHLKLTDGNIYGGSYLTMEGGAEITRTDGTIDSQLNFDGPCDFIYDSGGSTTTGFELPASGDSTNLRNLQTQGGTDLTFNSNRVLNGQLITTGSINLNNATLFLHGIEVDHTIGGDITNGTLNFKLLSGNDPGTNDDVKVNGDFELPNIITRGGPGSDYADGLTRLKLFTDKAIGVITNISDWVQINVVESGTLGNAVAGVNNNRGGVIWFDPQEDAVDIYVDGPVVANGSGRIYFHNDGQVIMGGLEIYDGLVEVNHTVNHDVSVRGNTEFIDGRMDVGPFAGTRTFFLQGQSNNFSSDVTFTDFSNGQALNDATDPTSGTSTTHMDQVTMEVKEFGAVTQQTITGTRLGTYWYGPLVVNNSSSGDAVIFSGDDFRGMLTVLNDITFTNTGQILMDNFLLVCGGDAAPYVGGGDFENDAGYVSLNGGRVEMNGNVPQDVEGDGQFADIAFNNNSQDPAASVTITGGVDIQCTEFVYLTKGLVDNSADNIAFTNAGIVPTLVRNDGLLVNAPIFNTPTNVVYIGTDKTTGNELPVGDTNLHNLSVETTNGCSPGRGRIYLDQDATVNGMLNINVDQALIIAAGHDLKLAGETATIDGDLASEDNSASLVLAAENGTELTGPGVLPQIVVAANSNGNVIDGSLGLFNGYFGADNSICGTDNWPVSGSLADLTFLPNGVDEESSLDVKFAASGNPHLKNLITDMSATLTLLDDLMQAGSLTHQEGAVINVSQYVYTVKGNDNAIEGNTEINGNVGISVALDENNTPGEATTQADGSEGKIVFAYEEPPAAESKAEPGVPEEMDVYVAFDAVINLVKIGSNHPTIAANVEVNLNSSATTLGLTSSTNAHLYLQGDFYLRRGNVVLGRNLWLQGSYFLLAEDGSITGNAILFLDAIVPPLAMMIEDSPDLNNVTIKNDVDLNGDNSDLGITGDFQHEAGLLDFSDVDITIKNTGQYNRDNGTYAATTGYLVIKTAVFNQGSGSFTIPNLRIATGNPFTAAGDAIFTVTNWFDLRNGTGNAFSHNGNLSIGDGVTFNFQDGTFDQIPDYKGTIRLNVVSTSTQIISNKIWPASPTSLVTTLNDSTVGGSYDVTLPGSRTVNDTLNLRKGNLQIPSGATFSLANDGVIKVVDGMMTLLGSATTSYGSGIHCYYYNNGTQKNTGPELPEEVEKLVFTRYRNIVNEYTVVKSAVSVTGENTLIIRNNVQADARITALGDIYFENESNVFPNATDPECVFNSPLEFAGPNDQNLYVPDDGLDLTGGGVAPANLMVNKTESSGIVMLRGGDLMTGTIFFANGLLDTQGDNSFYIPAPFTGLGQGFDRTGVAEGDMSHIVGNVKKKLRNGGTLQTATNERSEFPVGNTSEYRPVAITFKPEGANPTVPHNLEIKINHIAQSPGGVNGLPIVDGIAPGRHINGYPDFYWDIETNGTYSQSMFDLELAANGFSDYMNVTDLRIIRRHGDVDNTGNPWLLQGNVEDYDNAEYDDGPTVINKRSLGGLREEGALFTLGLEESVITSSHFKDQLVWQGKNPIGVMTVFVTKAEYFNNVPVDTWDEIAVFDNDHCVGYVKLTEPVSSTNPAAISCSVDDELTAAIDGFTPGHFITLKVWDHSEKQEYIIQQPSFYMVNNNTFLGHAYQFIRDSSVRAEFTMAEAMYSQQIIFDKPGWHIFSLAVSPSGSHNLFDTAGSDGLLNPLADELVKVQADNNQGTIEFLLGQWQNFIGDWSPTEGYYINVAEPCTLDVSGTVIESPLAIELQTGWNIISYPCIVSEQNALDVFDGLITDGFLEKAMDEAGLPLQELAFSGWYNGIGNMRPDEGYYIKVNQNCTMEIQCDEQNFQPKVTTAQPDVAPQHFDIEEGHPYQPMNIFVSEATVDGMDLRAGDEIAVYDGNKLVGAAYVSRDVSREQPLVITVAADDGSENGFSEGNAMRFKIWKADESKEIDVALDDVTYRNLKTGEKSGSSGFEALGSAFISIDASTEIEELPEAFELTQNYPNPFNPSTTIKYGLPNSSNVTLQVFDVTGKLVTTLISGQQDAGYHTVEWNGLNMTGHQVATGIYFYKIKAGEYTSIKKMMFAK